MNTRTIQVHGKNIALTEGGRDNMRPIILLHGVVGDAMFHWQRLIPDLSDQYRLIAPDLPGYGKTEALNDTSFEALIDWLLGLFDALDIEQAVVIGNSFGGLLARLFAAAYPQRVPALILVNGGNLPPKPSTLGKLIAGTPVVSSLFFGSLSRRNVASRGALAWVLKHNTDPQVLTDDMLERAKKSAPAVSRLMRIQSISTVPASRVPLIPTLILWGEEDEFANIKTGRAVHRAIPGSEWVPIADCKNAPHIEESDVVSYQIEHFLSNLDRPRGPDLPGVGMLG